MAVLDHDADKSSSGPCHQDPLSKSDCAWWPALQYRTADENEANSNLRNPPILNIHAYCTIQSSSMMYCRLLCWAHGVLLYFSKKPSANEPRWVISAICQPMMQGTVTLALTVFSRWFDCMKSSRTGQQLEITQTKYSGCGSLVPYLQQHTAC